MGQRKGWSVRRWRWKRRWREEDCGLLFMVMCENGREHWKNVEGEEEGKEERKEEEGQEGRGGIIL